MHFLLSPLLLLRQARCRSKQISKRGRDARATHPVLAPINNGRIRPPKSQGRKSAGEIAPFTATNNRGKKMLSFGSPFLMVRGSGAPYLYFPVVPIWTPQFYTKTGVTQTDHPLDHPLPPLTGSLFVNNLIRCPLSPNINFQVSSSQPTQNSPSSTMRP